MINQFTAHILYSDNFFLIQLKIRFHPRFDQRWIIKFWWCLRYDRAATSMIWQSRLTLLGGHGCIQVTETRISSFIHHDWFGRWIRGTLSIRSNWIGWFAMFTNIKTFKKIRHRQIWELNEIELLSHCGWQWPFIVYCFYCEEISIDEDCFICKEFIRKM